MGFSISPSLARSGKLLVLGQPSTPSLAPQIGAQTHKKTKFGGVNIKRLRVFFFLLGVPNTSVKEL